MLDEVGAAGDGKLELPPRHGDTGGGFLAPAAGGARADVVHEHVTIAPQGRAGARRGQPFGYLMGHPVGAEPRRGGQAVRRTVRAGRVVGGDNPAAQPAQEPGRHRASLAQRAVPATVSQKLASMIGMSVNTLRDRQASSKPRQLRTAAGRSRARVIRPASSSATQASDSPRDDSAQPRPVPPCAGGAAVPAAGPVPASGARVEELADEADRFGCLGEHDVKAGEDVAAVAGGPGRGCLVVGRGRVAMARVHAEPGRPGHRADEAQAACLLGGQDTGGLKPVHEGVRGQQRVGGAPQLAVGGGQVAPQRRGIRGAPGAADADHAEQVAVPERGRVDPQQPLQRDLGGAKIEVLPASTALTPLRLIICRLGMSGEAFEQELHAWLAAREPAGAVTALLEAAAEEDAAYLTTGAQIAAGIEGDTEAAWLSAMSLPAIRPYAVAELNRRAGRDARHDPLPGLEPAECDAVVMASRAIVAGYATGGADGVAAAVRQAAAPGSETVLFEQMWRSRQVRGQATLPGFDLDLPGRRARETLGVATR